jgi:adenine phosphoribosyltransferase
MTGAADGAISSDGFIATSVGRANAAASVAGERLARRACRSSLSAAAWAKEMGVAAASSPGMDQHSLLDLKNAIRAIPDYPRPGIVFRDITTLLGDARAFRRTVDELVQPFAGLKIAKIAGIEARGFILGGAVAHQLSAGFIPVRKKGKLPHETVSMSYQLEYGTDEIEVHKDAVKRGERVLLVDDLVATGGTAEAAVNLLAGLGAEVVAACFIVDLPDLGGADKVRRLGVPVRTLVSFAGH